MKTPAAQMVPPMMTIRYDVMRWVSARAIKETFNPPRDYRYPFMAEE